MSTASLPEVRLRISEAVIDKLVIAAAHEVRGVVDVHGMMLGALLGGMAGGTLGFLEAGPLGAAVGAPAGSMIGAAAGHMVSQMQGQHTFFEDTAPSIHLRLTALFGTNLAAVAEAVRAEVARTIAERTGLQTGVIDIEFVEVVPAPAVPVPPSA